MRSESLRLKFTGHVQIKDKLSGEIILDWYNAIHPQNMALAAARALAGDSTGQIFWMKLGNGGTFYNTGNQLVYRTPNTIGDVGLYNQTYQIQVDEQSAGTPASNSVIAIQAPAPSISSIVIVTAQLNVNEPAGQAAADNVTIDVNSPFIFDEIGLFTPDNKMISHLVFAPIEKTANRAFLITYSITVNVS